MFSKPFLPKSLVVSWDDEVVVVHEAFPRYLPDGTDAIPTVVIGSMEHALNTDATFDIMGNMDDPENQWEVRGGRT